ncbi:MAG: ABC transporter ATP-binding protein [Candidatus Cloacimonetes bacterium]|nr:ABC transporter ATP-binding protein [Candidatus Cloacimonadota bacterium]
MSDAFYQISNLDKYYGKFQALNAVDLQLSQGKIIGLLGKNGAGKSTLMRCMLGFLSFNGQISFDGHPIKRHDMRIFENVAFIPDVSGLDDRLTVQQTIDYVRGLNPGWNQPLAEKLLAISHLPLNKKVGKLSKGMKTKLYLLVTLALDIRYLLLDEPTLGLDIVFRKEFFHTILGEFFTSEKGILISTHQVEEVEDILQEVVIIDQGRILLHEDVESLKSRYRIVSLPEERASELYQHQPKNISRTLGFVSAVLDSSLEFTDARYSRANLADIFVALVGANNEAI